MQVQSNLPPTKEGIITFIGAGTGLGMAKGIVNKNKIIAIPSEGGHKEFAARTNQEWEIYNWLKKDLNLKRLAVERIVSGSGLGHIARWRLNKSDCANHSLKNIADCWRNHENKTDLDFPALVSEVAYSGDEIMKEVIDIWLSAYGSAAGDLALQELCQGGLWIAGGTAAKHIDGLCSEIFLNAFKNKGRFESYLEKIPIMAITDPEIGLYSAACKTRTIA